MEDWQSPISPGISWYQASAGDRPHYPRLDQSASFDVVIIGAGFTGLQAAYNLASSGALVAVMDAARIGDGASGRNGGQLGTGQRHAPEELEAILGFERSRALFDMAENAKAYLLDLAKARNIGMDFQPGQLNVSHKRRYEGEYRESAEIAAIRYGYRHLTFMEGEETTHRLGSSAYHFGLRDTGTGHINPLKLIIGLARAAHEAGAHIFELTRAIAIHQAGRRINVSTNSGTLTADRLLIAADGHIGDLEQSTASRVLPISSYIAATEPLDDFSHVIPGYEAVADSRFVVRYFRKTPDNRLLFGGREAYSSGEPKNTVKALKRQIVKTFPALTDVAITHCWGGSVGITLPRMPYVAEVMPGVTSIGGFSGHGVMLANYCGKLYADLINGKSDELDRLADLKIPPFPGGRLMRAPLMLLAMTWFSLRDRI